MRVFTDGDYFITKCEAWNLDENLRQHNKHYLYGIYKVTRPYPNKEIIVNKPIGDKYTSLAQAKKALNKIIVGVI